jgi:hypothetical protein
MQIDQIPGVLFLDCWNEEWLEQFYQRVRTNLNLDQFSSVCVANYEIELDSKDPAQYSTLKAYSWNSYVPDMLVSITRETRGRSTASWIKESFKNQSFLILDPKCLEYHVNHLVPHVQDWLVIGGSWNACLRSRPICIDSMKKLPYNFYITDWSIYNLDMNNLITTTEQINKDPAGWINLGNSLYQLSK